MAKLLNGNQLIRLFSLFGIKKRCKSYVCKIVLALICFRCVEIYKTILKCKNVQNYMLKCNNNILCQNIVYEEEKILYVEKLIKEVIYVDMY